MESRTQTWEETYTNTLTVNKDTNNKGTKTYQYILFFYCSGKKHKHRKSREICLCITAEKCQDGFFGQGRMRTDIGSQSESEEFAELSSAVISALDESFHDDTDWHIDIDIVLSANEFGADVSQFIHVLSVRGI